MTLESGLALRQLAVEITTNLRQKFIAATLQALPRVLYREISSKEKVLLVGLGQGANRNFSLDHFSRHTMSLSIISY